ncbi:DNA-binding response regulator [Paenibacillus mesophilus]|uniref:DNA-binding response regulator n=1 Tax=Paenibacillus mesophilus TaxID=2582849 RepID=UPI00110E45F7|nr:DNA-binding response regulator [Paenibacillus mesophilus]TMV49655.1 DNA-binding response regulator [Paenibacillus mesophilus]
MSYEAYYERFMLRHMEEAGEMRCRRLKDGLGHAEKLFLQQVWWPAVGHFDYLHPEYEVMDFKDGVRYLDFAYIRAPYQVCIEIDGYGPHGRDLSRWQFADNLLRQNHLVLDGWKVLRFAYDELTDKPRRCQQTVQQLLGRWYGDTHAPTELGISERSARTILHRLVQAGYLLPASGAARIRSYRLNPEKGPLRL